MFLKMAKYSGRAKEGSFESNLIEVPDEGGKIQAEGARQLRGIERAINYDREQQRIYDQATKAAFNQELKSSKRAGQQAESNARTQLSAAKEAYDIQLRNNEIKAQRNQQALSKVTDWLGIAQQGADLYSGIVAKNKEVQQKAINEISFKEGFDIDDLRNAKSVDSNISNSEWQRTQIVQDYVREGKSQEFINAMYEHLIKGGGYKNYIANGNVLTATAALHAQEQQELIDADLAPEDLRKRYEALLTKQRAELYVDGKVAGPQFIEQFYNPTIRAKRRTFDAKYNQSVKEATDQENNIQQNLIVNNALKGGDANGFNIEAAWNVAGNATRPGHARKFTELIIGQATTSVQIEELRKHKVEKDGQRIPLTYLDPAIAGLLDAASDRLYRKEVEANNKYVQAKQLEANQEQLKYLEGIRQQKGFITNDDVKKSIDIADDSYGFGRNKDIDGLLQQETIEEEYKPILDAQIQEMVENNTLSVKALDEIAAPRAMKLKHLSLAQQMDNMRATPEYKNSKKVLRGRIEGVLAQSPGVIKFSIEGGDQSDQVNWFIGEQLKKYHKEYTNALLVGTQDALQLIGNKAAIETEAYINNEANVFKYRITAYDSAMAQSDREMQAVTGKVRAWIALDGNKRKDPNNWVQIIGEKSLQVATQELQQKGSSETFKQIAQTLGISQYEAQNQVAEVSPNIEPVEMPLSFQEFMNNYTPAEQNFLQNSIYTNERKLQLLSRFNNEPPPLRSSFQVQQPQATKYQEGDWVGADTVEVTGKGTAPKSHTDALIDVAGKLGVNPIDLATIISFESAGTFDPNIVGGEGGNYQGLIQFGIPERKAYGVVPGMTFEEQLRGPVYRYLVDRFAAAGWDTQGATLEDLYTTVIAGNPGANRDAKDSFGTSARSGVAKMGGHREKAMKRFGMQ